MYFIFEYQSGTTKNLELTHPEWVQKIPQGSSFQTSDKKIGVED
jgi:hypothetical protein